MKKRARIKDVAKLAEVSVGTVSHYLNGRFVSETRSERIRNAIAELGFSSSLLAKGMRTQRSSVVGLCMPYPTFSNYSTLVDALDVCVAGANYELMQVLSRQDPNLEYHRVQRLVGFKVGGVLLVPSLEPQSMLDFLHASNVPTVILSRPLPEEDRFDQVAVDHESAMRKMTKALIARGRRRLLFIVRFPALLVTQQRLAAIEAAVRQSGQAVGWRLISCAETAEGFAADFDAIMASQERPDGIILSNDVMTGWALSGLKRHGIAWQSEISVVSLHKPMWADLVSPEFASVEQPTRELARQGWECLRLRMQEPDRPTQRIALDAYAETHLV